MRAFTRFMGIRRAGEKIQDAVRSLINGLLREDRLESDGQLFAGRAEKLKRKAWLGVERSRVRLQKKDRGIGMKEMRPGMKRNRKTWEFLNRPPTSYFKVTERNGTTYIIEKDRTLIYIQADQKKKRYYNNGQSTFCDPSRNIEESPLVGDAKILLTSSKRKSLSNNESERHR